MLAPGIWYVHCPSEPAWNATGTASVGMFGKPDALTAHLATVEARLGHPPPKDCVWGYEKD